MTTTTMPAGGAAAPVTPITTGARHVLAWDDVAFEVDAAVGGRITTFSLAGRNLLTGPEVDPGNYGSTFWTSPQSAWGWPPLPEIDHQPYRASFEADTIVLRGAASPKLGVEVEKRFSADRARGAVTCAFRVRNRGAAPLALAPWQISRVPPGGLSFFPTGDGAFPPSNLAVAEAHGMTFYAYDRAAVTDHQKLFADGREGWLAHVDGDALFVKTFAAVARARQAPGEAQIEIYATPAHTYVEVEVQGAYETIAPGAALDWQVVWLARRLPAALARAVAAADARAALAAHVRAVVVADARAAVAADARAAG
jgi:hypothetical protein